MAPQTSLHGETLADRYEIRRKIGEGRTGSVYMAMDHAERRKVAIKMLHAPLCEVPEHLRRFEREFELTRRIVHPHTVEMYELGEAGGRRYLVMEFLEGKRLDQLVEARGTLTVHEVCRIAIPIAQALQAAHAQGVIHRDLNPTNVMLLPRSRPSDGPPEHVKVLDFGMSRLLDTSEELTGFGTRLGSAGYMAPEYIKHSQLDARSDLYSFGCILFYMLAGRPPFIGPSMRVLNSHVKEPAPAPSSANPGLPDWLDHLVLQLLDKDPNGRPGLDEILAVLQRGGEEPVLSEDPQTHSMEGQSASVITTGLGQRGALPGGPPPPEQGNRLFWLGLALPALLGAATLLGILAMMLIGWWLFAAG